MGGTLGVSRVSQSKPECHPDEKYYAKGMCRKCYGRMCYHERYGESIRLRTNANHLKKDLARFGMTERDYDNMVAEQYGRCAICLDEPKGRRLDLDHDEKTMKARGLLCNSCNQAIGLLKHDVGLLIKAQQYLSR